MSGGHTARSDVTDRDGSAEVDDELAAAIEDVFDRVMALDGAMSTLVDAEVRMARPCSTRKLSAPRTAIDRNMPRHCASSTSYATSLAGPLLCS
jgi:hypothetical protein